jgi:hypothetical protein
MRREEFTGQEVRPSGFQFLALCSAWVCEVPSSISAAKSRQVSPTSGLATRAPHWVRCGTSHVNHGLLTTLRVMGRSLAPIRALESALYAMFVREFVLS